MHISMHHAITEGEWQMATGGSTKSQMAYINRLLKTDMERNEIIEKFLLDRGKARVQELSVKEASELIDKLKSNSTGHTLNGMAGGESASEKQASFILALQTDEARKAYVNKFLEAGRKKSLQELSVKEASELISDLKAMPSMGTEERGNFLITPKQLRFIAVLEKKPGNSKTVTDYLTRARKGMVDELLSSEASELITMLKNRAQ